jgi:template-activating factor I
MYMDMFHSTKQNTRMSVSAKKSRVDDSGGAAAAGESNASSDGRDDALIRIQEQLEQLNRQLAVELLAVEQKFNALRRPLFDERALAIAARPDAATFWAKAFLGHSTLRQLLTDADRVVFQSLRDVRVVDHSAGGQSGFRISMRFDANERFSNTMLFKDFTVTDDGQTIVTCSPLQLLASAASGGGARLPHSSTSGKRKRDDTESFFSWFSPEDQDITLGELIKEELWPQPLKWVAQYEAANDDDNQGNDDSDDDDDSDDSGGGDSHQDATANQRESDESDEESADDRPDVVDPFGGGSDGDGMFAASTDALPTLAGSSFAVPSFDPLPLVASSADFHHDFDDSFLKKPRDDDE